MSLLKTGLDSRKQSHVSKVHSPGTSQSRAHMGELQHYRNQRVFPKMYALTLGTLGQVTPNIFMIIVTLSGPTNLDIYKGTEMSQIVKAPL